MHTVPLQLSVSDDVLDAIVRIAVGSCGIHYWCAEYTPLTGPNQLLWAYKFVIREDLRSEIPDEPTGVFYLAKSNLLRGISKWLSAGNFTNRHIMVPWNERGELVPPRDGPEADVIMQYSLFGKVLYG